MPPSTIIEETKIPKLGKHSHINSDGNLSTRHTSSTSGLYGNAGCSASILCHPGVLFNTTAAGFLFSRNIAPPRAMVAWYRTLSDYTIIRRPDCLLHQSKHVPVHTKSSDSDWLLIFLITTNCYETERTKAARTKQFNRGINYGRN